MITLTALNPISTLLVTRAGTDSATGIPLSPARPAPQLSRRDGLSADLNRLGIKNRLKPAIICLLCCASVWLAPTRLTAQPQRPAATRSAPGENPASTTRKLAAEQNESVAELLSQLDSSNRLERLAAERRLLEQGPSILPQLPGSAAEVSPAVWTAVERIRNQLELVAIEQSLAPSRATIRGPLTTRDVLQTLSQQTQNPLQLKSLTAEQAARPWMADFDKASFWEILSSEEFLPAEPHVDLARLLQPQSNIKRDNPRPVAAMDSGAFLWQVRDIDRRPLFGSPNQHRLRLNLRLMWEPRLRVLFVRFRPGRVQPRCDSAPGLQPMLTPEAVIELPIRERGKLIEFPLDLTMTAAAPAAEFAVSGTAELEIAAREVPFEFALQQLHSRQQRRSGGVQVAGQIVSQSAAGTRMTTIVRLNVNYDRGGRAFESHRTWLYHNAIRLETADSEVYRPKLPLDIRQQSDGGVIIEYRFEHPLEKNADLKLVYQAPTLITRRSVPFRFEQLRIPPPIAGP